jgi:hypothetical protein
MAANAPVNTVQRQNRILVGTPTLGTIRIEWHNAITGLVIPCNWSTSSTTPIGYLTADGQNLITHELLNKGFEWLLFLEDDTIPPSDLFLRLAPYIEHKKYPIVSGLYHVKGSTEPMIYRGRGNGAFKKWKRGELVWADGVPTGCILIHSKIIAELAKVSENYIVHSGGNPFRIKKIFESPRSVFTDPSTGDYMKMLGTSDLFFCEQVLKHNILLKAGWKSLATKEFPFLVDTNIACGHIDRETGRVW